MAIPIKGKKEVDKTALKQLREACQYADKNRYQLSQEILVDAISQLGETSSRLKETLDWRIKQGAGSVHVQRLNNDIASLQKRLADVEQKVGVTVSDEASTEVGVGEAPQQQEPQKVDVADSGGASTEVKIPAEFDQAADEELQESDLEEYAHE